MPQNRRFPPLASRLALGLTLSAALDVGCGDNADRPTCKLEEVTSGGNCGCELTIPVDPDQLTDVDAFWPYGVHGGGHPEGHRGWDFIHHGSTLDVVSPGDGRILKLEGGYEGEYIEGGAVYALLDCGIEVTFQPVVLEPGLVVGSRLTQGVKIGRLAELVPSFGADRFSMHVDARVRTPDDQGEEEIQCARPFYSDADQARLDALVQAVTYDEKTARDATFSCADGTTATFSLPAEDKLCNDRVSAELNGSMTQCLQPGPGRQVW